MREKSQTPKTIIKHNENNEYWYAQTNTFLTFLKNNVALPLTPATLLIAEGIKIIKIIQIIKII